MQSIGETIESQTVRGEILELKDTINTMVNQFSAFASKVTRVAREVGTEGKSSRLVCLNDVAASLIGGENAQR
jgi:hypothetical protein